MSVVTPDATDSSSTASSNLPLDWTRLGPSSSSRTTNNNTSFCCNDPSQCRQKQHSTTTASSRLPSDRTTNMMDGYAVFCLHELNPSWFQGYFIPNQTLRPWGLLAVQEQVDDCLGCADGGFRRITLNIYPPSESQPKKKKKKKEKEKEKSTSIKVETIDWTGGDMIRLRHEQLVMDADRLWTGTATLPHLERYFAGLIAKLRIEWDADGSTPVLEFLPDIAIIMGKMSLAQNTDGLDSDYDFVS